MAAAATAVDARPAAALVDLPLNIGGFREGVYVPIDDQLLGQPGGASIVANGNLSLTWAGSELRPEFNDEGDLDSFESDLGLRGAITLDATATSAGAFDDVLQVVTIPVGEFQAGPVDVTTYLGVNVRLSGEAEAGAQLSMVAPFDVSAALSKRGGRHRADSAERPRFQPEIGLPDAANALAFRVSVELELTVTFMMSIDGVPIGGPVLQASLGAVLDVDPGDAPWWTINGLAGLGYGWSMPDVDDGKPLPPDRIYELFTQQPWLIADADGDPPPLADASTRWSRSFDIHEDDEAGAVIADGDGLVVLERDGTPWMATLSGLGNPTWQEQSTPLMTVEGAARTAAGDLVTAGASGLGGVRVERFDAARRSEWAEQIDIDNLQSGTWSAVVPTGEGVIVAGNVRHTDGTDAAALVAVDGQGDVRWATEIDPGPLHTDVNVRAAERAPNGDLLIVGQACLLPRRGARSLACVRDAGPTRRHRVRVHHQTAARWRPASPFSQTVPTPSVDRPPRPETSTTTSHGSPSSRPTTRCCGPPPTSTGPPASSPPCTGWLQGSPPSPAGTSCPASPATTAG